MTPGFLDADKFTDRAQGTTLLRGGCVTRLSASRWY
jgi:hypothetical protein